MLTVFMEIQVKWMPNLEIILDSHDAEVCLVSNSSMNEFYNFNYFESNLILLYFHSLKSPYQPIPHRTTNPN